MANNRIYYAVQQVVLGKAAGTLNTDKNVIHGLQTVGMTTNFNLEQVFEIGQLSIYQNVETTPDVEVTLNKVLDGYPLVYVLATELGSSMPGTVVAVDPTIAGRQNARTDMQLTIFKDTSLKASGDSSTSSLGSVTCSGMYVSSVSYTFPVDGNFTEDVTLVGNNKSWGTGQTGGFGPGDDSPASSGGVARRQHLDMASCRFPSQIPGITAGGLNTLIGGASGFNTHFTNITVSCDFGREAINELGALAPYHRYVTFPVEVTSEFEIIAVDGKGDNIYATESGYYVGLTGTGIATASDTGCVARHNLLDQTIFLETCEGTRIYLGTKNKLTSVNYTGGDTGGGNVTITYSYSTFNDFVVAHKSGNFYSQLANSTYTPAA